MGFLLFGGPGETKETVNESLKFADSIDLEAMKITIGIRIYPPHSRRYITHFIEPKVSL